MWIRKELLDASLDFQCLRAGYADIKNPYEEQSGSNNCCVLSVLFEGVVHRRFVNPEAEYDVHPGDVSFLPAWRQGHSHAPDGLRCGWLHFRFVFLGSYDYLDFFHMPQVFTGKAAKSMKTIQARLATLCAQSTTMGYKELALVKIQGFRLLEVMLQHAEMRADSETLLANMHRLGGVLQFLRQHYAQPLTITDLAREANMSRSRFHAHFEKTLGIAPMRYLRICRMEKARELLLTSDLDIAQIGAAVGYADAFHFSRNFRQTVGICPRDYRKRRGIVMY